MWYWRRETILEAFDGSRSGLGHFAFTAIFGSLPRGRYTSDGTDTLLTDLASQRLETPVTVLAASIDEWIAVIHLWCRMFRPASFCGTDFWQRWCELVIRKIVR